jgi:hypothetical protein
MDGVLVVIRQFGRYAQGDTVDDAGQAEAILRSEHRRNVVRVVTPAVGVPLRREV